MLHKRITLNHERFQYYRNFGKDGFKQLIRDQKLPESAKIVDFEVFHGIGGKVESMLVDIEYELPAEE